MARPSSKEDGQSAERKSRRNLGSKILGRAHLLEGYLI